MSATPDITESIPTPLSAAVEASQAASSNGARFDVTIGGIGFTLAASDQNPYLRQTAPVQKQQFDASREAGEQTLEGDWVRSQTSWHHGAGTRFYEPGSDPASVYRFDDSLGVDVFNRDTVTLLKRCAVAGAVSSGQVAYATGAVVGGADVLFTNENGVIKRRNSSGGVAASYTPTAATPAGPVAVGGTKIYVGATSFGIDQGDASGSALSRLYNQGLGTTPIPYWVKARLVASRGRSLYELAPDGSTGGGDIDAATALYTHPDTGWTWSAVVEAPTAILASGYSNGRSAIFRFTLEDADSGATPILSQAYQVAEFPVGEEVLSLHVHLGAYVGIGTTKGVRVGILGGDGQIQYGPLLVECGPVRDLDASDRFLYGAVTAAHPDGNSGAVVVDLSEEVEQNTLRFPYAWHVRTGTAGRVDSVAVLGASGRVALGAFGEGVYLQSATEHEDEGWVRSGRIRFATVELKRFRTVDIGATLPDGQIGLYVIDRDGDETYVRNLTTSASDGRGTSLAGAAGQAVEFLQLRLRLSASADNLTAPSLDSLLLRAVPVVNRQELIQYPLLCMDREQMAGGRKYGKEGYAFQRFSALKTLEQTMAVVTVSDRTTGETFQAQIEQVEFRRPGPPSADGRANWGGILSVTVKK